MRADQLCEQLMTGVRGVNIVGTDEVGFEVTSSRFDGETRHFDRFSQPLEEIIDARIWAGLHYRTADIQAQILGETIVDYMAENYFQPES